MTRWRGARLVTLTGPGGIGKTRLTRREQDVAALVARGMSNSQIAATLVISVRTVETHVQHIMDKLGCSTGRRSPPGQRPSRRAEQPNIGIPIRDSPDVPACPGCHPRQRINAAMPPAIRENR